jgi:hypothetical protein
LDYNLKVSWITTSDSVKNAHLLHSGVILQIQVMWITLIPTFQQLLHSQSKHVFLATKEITARTLKTKLFDKTSDTVGLFTRVACWLAIILPIVPDMLNENITMPTVSDQKLLRDAVWAWYSSKFFTTAQRMM